MRFARVFVALLCGVLAVAVCSAESSAARRPRIGRIARKQKTVRTLEEVKASFEPEECVFSGGNLRGGMILFERGGVLTRVEWQRIDGVRFVTGFEVIERESKSDRSIQR
jgi:hypothetical protein